MKLFNKKKQPCCCNDINDLKDMTVLEHESSRDVILILGSGCAKCNALKKAVHLAIDELNLHITIQHVTDFAAIAAYGIMTTPALVLHNKVVSYGKVLSVDEVKTILMKEGY